MFFFGVCVCACVCVGVRALAPFRLVSVDQNWHLDEK